MDTAELLPGLQRSGTWCTCVHMMQCMCAALHVLLLHLSMASGTCYSLQRPEQEGRVDNMCAFGTAAVMCGRYGPKCVLLLWVYLFCANLLECPLVLYTHFMLFLWLHRRFCVIRITVTSTMWTDMLTRDMYIHNMYCTMYNNIYVAFTIHVMCMYTSIYQVSAGGADLPVGADLQRELERLCSRL